RDERVRGPAGGGGRRGEAGDRPGRAGRSGGGGAGGRVPLYRRGELRGRAGLERRRGVQARVNGPANLEWLRERRSVRVFAPRVLDHAVLERILEAAITAPSSTNRQPWRFALVTGARTRAALVDAVRRRTEALKAVVRLSHH